MRSGAKVRSIVVAGALLTASVPGSSSRGQPAPPPAPTCPELDRLEMTVRTAQSALVKYRRSGGEPGASNHPGATWAERLWTLREGCGEGEVRALATSQALRLWSQAGRWDEVAIRVRDLDPADRAWPRVFGLLEEGAGQSGDFSLLLEQAERLLPVWTDPGDLARLHALLGRVAQSRGLLDEAVEQWEAVVRLSPGSELSVAAQGEIYELESLRPGQPAPVFEARARDERRVSLLELRGHPVLILFWASW